VVTITIFVADVDDGDVSELKRHVAWMMSHRLSICLAEDARPSLAHNSQTACALSLFGTFDYTHVPIIQLRPFQYLAQVKLKLLGTISSAHNHKI